MESRPKDGCASFRGPTKLNRSATGDQRDGRGVDNVTQLMPLVGVVPSQRDEAMGQSRCSKHVTAEFQISR
jgi:hypothetical protein